MLLMVLKRQRKKLSLLLKNRWALVGEQITVQCVWKIYIDGFFRVTEYVDQILDRIGNASRAPSRGSLVNIHQTASVSSV